MKTDAACFAGWIPIGLYWRGKQPMVDWCFAGDAPFTDPFFEQTIAGLVRQPFNLLFRHQTPLETLADINPALPGLQPAGFIFHWSRCGSTVISRMLAALPQNLVLSEPRLLDFVFQAHPVPVSDEQRIVWLRALVGALGQKRLADQTRCVVKFDSWHTLHLPLVRRAFPKVPWLFIYRDPVEILVSHHNQPAAQMVPGYVEPRLLGVDTDTISRMEPDEYCARVLAAISQAALTYAQDPNARFVNHRALPEIGLASVLPLFKIPCDAADIKRLREVARFNAKEPSLPFTPDSSAKQKEASDRIRWLSDQFLRPWYDQLELRTSACSWLYRR